MSSKHCHESEECCGMHRAAETAVSSELELKARRLAGFRWTPEPYRNNPENCLLALMVSVETGIEPFFIMRNLKFSGKNAVWHPGSVRIMLAGLGNIRPMRSDSGKAISFFAVDGSTGTVYKSEKIDIAEIRDSAWFKAAAAFWQLDVGTLAEHYAEFMFLREFVPELLLRIPFLENIYSAFEDSSEEILLPANISRLSEKLKEIGSPFTTREVINFVKSKEKQFQLELVLANLESINHEISKEKENV